MINVLLGKLCGIIQKKLVIKIGAFILSFSDTQTFHFTLHFELKCGIVFAEILLILLFA